MEATHQEEGPAQHQRNRQRGADQQADQVSSAATLRVGRAQVGGAARRSSDIGTLAARLTRKPGAGGKRPRIDAGIT